MPLNLNKNMNATPIYSVDENGNTLPLAADSNGLVTQIKGPGGGPAYVLSNDGDNNPAFIAGLVVNGMNRVFNGSSWDRQRGDGNGAFMQGSSANGAANTGNPVTTGGVANSSTPTAVGNGQSVNARYSTTGSAYVTLSTTSGSAIATGSTSDNTSGSSVLGSVPYVYNGTNYDRQRDANTAAGSTGIGILGAGVLGYDGTNYQRLSTTTSGSLNVAYGGVTVGATSIAADALSAAASVRVASFPTLHNGTTWDRQRDANSANGTTGTGIAAAGIMGQFQTSLPSYTSGQFGTLAMNSRGALAVSGRAWSSGDGQTNTLVIIPDEGSGSRLLATGGFNYNGTTWDRNRGDTTGTWTHAPNNTASGALSGTIATSGATVSVAFDGVSRQEVINPSTGTLWARWGAAPAVNGAGSFPIAPGGSYSTDRTTGTLQLLSTAASQSYTVNRFS